MTAVINHDAELRGLLVVMRSTLVSIDDALDRGDRRAFRTWCRKRASVTARAGSVLVDLARTEAR